MLGGPKGNNLHAELDRIEARVEQEKIDLVQRADRRAASIVKRLEELESEKYSISRLYDRIKGAA